MIASEHLAAFGRLGVWRSRKFISAMLERIPPEYFINPLNTILPDGWATSGWDETAKDWANWNGPEWGDVRFRRDDVLLLLRKLKRIEPPAGNGLGGFTDDESGTAPPTGESSEHPAKIPAWLTLMETVTWIVSRDPGIVSFASTDRSKLRSNCVAKELPAGGRPDDIDLPTRFSLLWLEQWRNAASHEITTDGAVEALVNALCEGRAVARGTWVATGEIRDMSAADWSALSLDTPPREHWRLVPVYRGDNPWGALESKQWTDVRLNREHVLRLWPAEAADLGAPGDDWSKPNPPWLAHRLALAERFRDRHRERREWICFADIADWLARANGDIIADEQRRTAAYRQLAARQSR
jgi:hypothetical protein